MLFDRLDGYAGRQAQAGPNAPDRGQVRVFKRLNAAVGVLFEIGFKEVKIVQ